MTGLRSIVQLALLVLRARELRLVVGGLAGTRRRVDTRDLTLSAIRVRWISSYHAVGCVLTARLAGSQIMISQVTTLPGPRYASSIDA